MSSFCGFIVAISIMALPIAFIIFLISLLLKKGIKKALLALCIPVASIILFTIIGVTSYTFENRSFENTAAPKDIVTTAPISATENLATITDALSETLAEQVEIEDIKETSQSTSETVIEEADAEEIPEISAEGEAEPTIIVSDLSEEEYKNMCLELWYDDIFFSEDNLEGEYVKLELFIEEAKYFKADSIYNSTIVDFVNKYNLQRNLYACGVLREDADSYVGGQIYLYFSDDYSYKASDYETGQEITIYGEIVDYSTNTWDGYNVCGIIPRYIEVVD